jgi:hypothetical protein
MRKLLLVLVFPLLSWGTDTSGIAVADSAGVEEKTKTYAAAGFSAEALAEWCQEPSWAFGLPNIVAYMGIVCLIAILATVVAITLTNRDQKVTSAVTAQQNGFTPGNLPLDGAAGMVLTDRAGEALRTEQGEENSFLIFKSDSAFPATHDETRRQITVEFDGEDYVYTDNLGKGTYLCNQAGAPLGNLLKVRPR